MIVFLTAKTAIIYNLVIRAAGHCYHLIFIACSKWLKIEVFSTSIENCKSDPNWHIAIVIKM